jgi:hypothetical protein
MMMVSTLTWRKGVEGPTTMVNGHSVTIRGPLSGLCFGGPGDRKGRFMYWLYVDNSRYTPGGSTDYNTAVHFWSVRSAKDFVERLVLQGDDPLLQPKTRRRAG